MSDGIFSIESGDTFHLYGRIYIYVRLRLEPL